MKYFFDHATDALSLVMGEFTGYATSEQIGPNVVVHFDTHGQTLAIDIHNASNVVDTAGLIPMYERPIAGDEVARRMSAREAGQQVLANLSSRFGFVVLG